jgi:hypothetical protein
MSRLRCEETLPLYLPPVEPYDVEYVLPRTEPLPTLYELFCEPETGAVKETRAAREPSVTAADTAHSESSEVESSTTDETAVVAAVTAQHSAPSTPGFVKQAIESPVKRAAIKDGNLKRRATDDRRCDDSGERKRRRVHTPLVKS